MGVLLYGLYSKGFFLEKKPLKFLIQQLVPVNIPVNITIVHRFLSIKSLIASYFSL